MVSVRLLPLENVRTYKRNILKVEHTVTPCCILVSRRHLYENIYSSETTEKKKQEQLFVTAITLHQLASEKWQSAQLKVNQEARLLLIWDVQLRVTMKLKMQLTTLRQAILATTSIVSRAKWRICQLLGLSLAFLKALSRRAISLPMSTDGSTHQVSLVIALLSILSTFNFWITVTRAIVTST